MSGFRRYGRKPLKREVRISHENLGDIVAETQDVSETGVFIRSPDLSGCMSVGETVDAALYEDDSLVRDTQLVVVRTTTEGVGLAFE